MWRLNIIPGLADLLAGRFLDSLIAAVLVPALYLFCFPLGLLAHAVCIQHARTED